MDTSVLHNENSKWMVTDVTYELFKPRAMPKGEERRPATKQQTIAKVLFEGDYCVAE